MSVPADIGEGVEEVERLVREVGRVVERVDVLFANAGATCELMGFLFFGFFFLEGEGGK